VLNHFHIDSPTSDVEPNAHCLGTDSNSKPTPEEEQTQRKARDQLWADFKASAPAVQPEHTMASKRLVKIEKRYRFAGEDVVEFLDVPEGSKDAKTWPLADHETRTPIAPNTAAVASTSASIIPETVNLTTNKPSRPGPRKPKTSLPPLPSSSSQKAKKLTTLDKSAMDWRAHLNSSADPGLKDQLEENRKAGGYLDKVEFLERVGKRKDDILDTNKSNKRRR